MSDDEKKQKIGWMRERAGLESFLQPMFKTMKRAKNGETKTWTQALLLGDTLLVAFPGEAVAELGIKIREDFAPKKVAVLGVTNDHLAYLTTQKIFDEGGYEAGMALVYPDSSYKIVDSLEKMAKELEGE
jgi:hypothetical protein